MTRKGHRSMDKCSEYWIDCVNWLVRCEVLRPDHGTLQSGARIEDLAYTLRDGVLLCSLVNALDPDCINIQNVNLNPQATRCLCIQNIETFLKTCHDAFSMKEHDLFESSMLFDLTGFYQVLTTLSILSNTSKALRRTPYGFHVPDSGSSDKIQIREVDSRRSLELSENASLSIHRESIRQDAIYEKLVTVRTREISVNNTRKKEKRAFIVEEIIATEKSYLYGVLKTVLETYMKPLKTILSVYDTKAIFGDMEKLAELHEDFYQDLLQSSLPENNLQLSDVFLRCYHQFLIYGDYCANLPRAQELLKITSNSRVDVKDMLNTCQAELKNGRFYLSDMLVVPMQHVLKYRLLLERLKRETAADHPEYDALQKAYEAMVDVNTYVNEVKRDREALQTIEKIESRIIDLQMPGNKTLKDFGRLHKDDELRIKFMDHKVGNRYVFIFDQVMLICKTLKDGTFACQEALNLSSYKIKDMQVTTRWGYHWSLIHKSQNTVYIIYARNEEHKRTWMQAIMQALDNIEPPGAKKDGHSYMMCTFDKPTMCDFCSKSLKGLIMQGYTCYNCRITIHKMCINDNSPCSTECQTSKLQTELPPPPYGDVTNWSDYRFLGQYPWFAGIMPRRDADRILQEQKRGTFMLRISPKHQHNSGYAISLKTIQHVTHMLVWKRTSHNTLQFYLSEARYFPSVVELIEFYRHWPLQENFEDLHEKLTRPYKGNTENGASSENFSTAEGEDADDEYADYLDMDKAEEKVPKYRDVQCATLNGQDTISPVSPSYLHSRGFNHQSNIDQIDNHEHDTEMQYENIVAQSHHQSSSSINKSGSLEVETQEDCSSPTSNLPYYEDDDRLGLATKKPITFMGERSSPIVRSDTSTQTQTAAGHVMSEQDIEKFGEYVVAALKLVKNKHTLRELTSEIRKIINVKLDSEH